MQKVLEFNKIISMLKEHTTNTLSEKMAENLKPVTTLDEAQALMNELSSAYDMIMKKGNPQIGGMKEITASLKRAEKGGILSAGELLEIGRVYKIARLLTIYKEDEDSLSQYFSLLTVNRKAENEISNAIISEEEIADSASPELASIRRKRSAVHSQIRESLSNIIHSSTYQKYLQESIVTMRDGRYVVPVKAEHRSDVGGIVHDISKAGSTVFIEPNSVVNGNNKLRELDAQEEEEIQKILASLTAMIGEEIHELFVNQRVISQLDFLFAKAKLAVSMKAIIPLLNDKKIIKIEKGRHPLLAPDKVVPISLELGEHFKTLVITGPNTGGKTVTLKTIGLFCLMASSGLAIPAEDGTDIAIFDNIYADIGDEQSIEQNLSTFSSHMTNIVSILNDFTPNSLILFDELGAGTDPTEGAALAISILKYTKDMGALTAATTHYSEIKLYALSSEDVENASCEFDVNSLKPTYKLLLGVPGKSNAFAISKKLGLPEFIIDNANAHLTDENIKFEDVISGLELSRKEAETERQTANRYRREIEQMRNEIAEEKRKISKTRERINDNASREAKKILEQAKRDAEEIISEIKKAQKEQSKQETARLLNEARTKINKKMRENDERSLPQKKVNKEVPKNLIAGNTVELLDINQSGTVITPPDDDGNVLVMVGIMKMNTHITNLRIVEEVTEHKDVPKYRGGQLRMTNVKTEIDLRGQNLEDALYVTEKYLDDASLAGLNEVTVIHGKGTGVLRKGIHEMLRRHPNVKSFRLGTYGEGETGVTVVDLK